MTYTSTESRREYEQTGARCVPLRIVNLLSDTGHDQEFRKWEPYLLIPVGLVTYRFIHLELWDDSALWVFVVQAACALVVARAVVSVATGRAFLKLSIAWRRLLVAVTAERRFSEPSEE